MAQQTILVDDLDGSMKNVETISFALDGKEYEIDLGEENAQQLREALAPYIEVSRRPASKRTRSNRGGGQATSSTDAAKIREWAAANGYEINARGRIPREVRDAYHRAQ